MLKRLCIYIIYDVDKIVDRYIGVVLKALKEISEKLIVVCNFDSVARGEEYITEYADEVFYRRNQGYDAGAYKEVLLSWLTWQKVCEYDELLLTNDSYFGPIYSFKEMFIKMSEDDCHYWGITSSAAISHKDGTIFPEHIQSYFLNFKTEVLHSKVMKKYWEEYVGSDDRFDTIKKFEIGINSYLLKYDYIGKAYMDLFELTYAKKPNVNPYLIYTYELLCDIRMPVIKKAALTFDNPGYVNIVKALEYIKSETVFDYSLIEEYVNRKRKMGREEVFYDFNLMEQFVMSHARIFFYGNGKWAHYLADYFQYRGWSYNGYIVSNMETENKDENLFVFSEIELFESDGIIIAQKYEKVCNQILKYISERCTPNMIFTAVYK